MSENFDVIVIGAGPAGYVAALRCAQLGFTTACIDDWMDGDRPSPGGTCLNVGCIPSKALIESSELYDRTRREYAAHGIVAESVSLDLATLLARKDKIVRELTSGVASLFMANQVKYIHGRGMLQSDRSVKVTATDSDAVQTLNAIHIILATGSSPTELAVAPLTHNWIVDSAGALAFPEVPRRLGVIGAGVIALELGGVWRRLGAEVIMFKSSQRFLPTADQQIAETALQQYTKQGLDIRMGVKISACEVVQDQVELHYTDAEGGDYVEQFDKLIVAIGRQPNSANLVAEGLPISYDERGFVQVDEYCCTTMPGVYAIGDLVRGPMLAHKGSAEGVMVAERLAGQHTSVNYATIPSVIYTSPEIAWIGKTEQELQADGVNYSVGSFPFSANGRAKALGHTDGFIKLLADQTTDRLLGAHMIGPQCSELIMQTKIALDFGASSEDLAMTMFAHPTLSEALHEAALSVAGHPLHIVQKRKN